MQHKIVCLQKSDKLIHDKRRVALMLVACNSLLKLWCFLWPLFRFGNLQLFVRLLDFLLVVMAIVKSVKYDILPFVLVNELFLEVLKCSASVIVVLFFAFFLDKKPLDIVKLGAIVDENIVCCSLFVLNFFFFIELHAELLKIVGIIT